MEKSRNSLLNLLRLREKQDVCIWYNVCPLKRFYEQGKLPKKWIEDYCRGDNTRCVRRRMEEEGKYHPDNMLPDGTIDRGLR